MNPYLLKTKQNDFIIASDYKIVTSKFLEILCNSLQLETGLKVNTEQVARMLTPIEKVTLDNWGNYDYTFKNGMGTLKGERVVFLEVMKGEK